MPIVWPKATNCSFRQLPRHFFVHVFLLASFVPLWSKRLPAEHASVYSTTHWVIPIWSWQLTTTVNIGPFYIHINNRLINNSWSIYVWGSDMLSALACTIEKWSWTSLYAVQGTLVVFKVGKTWVKTLLPILVAGCSKVPLSSSVSKGHHLTPVSGRKSTNSIIIRLCM